MGDIADYYYEQQIGKEDKFDKIKSKRKESKNQIEKINQIFK